ncbi:YopN family type III secretion system gatekeeper subunit [Pseudomonas tructae]|uniref:YopN family type III secretion system gatekeeper subunit n=1 Tax=Pseudomonas tructae TaxID=2518644 RepID=A0A411MLN2_9PSED|nr:type III secretion system gatekeeper subunit SctW [Pseudomonas tructae]QBF27725.1 YopN family type III secretion system gatekeeper subunit [Pseudomonas tructae]
MIPVLTGLSGRAAQARLSREQAAQSQAQTLDNQDDVQDPLADHLQRAVQSSDDLAQVMAQFRRRQFELKSESASELFERVLDDDAPPKARQLLALAADRQLPWALLLQEASGLFADDSDLALILSLLLRQADLAADTRKRLQQLEQSLAERGCPRRIQAGINAALKARLYGRRMAVRAAALRENYRDFLESEDSAADHYEQWIGLYGPEHRHSVLSFLEESLLTDIQGQDPSCSLHEYGPVLILLGQLKQLRSADRLFLAALRDSLQLSELDGLVLLLGVLRSPHALDELLQEVLGPLMLTADAQARARWLQRLRQACLALPGPLFNEDHALLYLAERFEQLADSSLFAEVCQLRRQHGLHWAVRG